MTTTTQPQDRTPQRVRHELRFRRLTVSRVERPTPHLVRVTLSGSDLDGFSSPGFDDHVKVFFPDPVTGQLVVPAAGPDGPSFPEGPKPIMRDYTPGRFDADKGTLELEFALHEPAGPATAWAAQADVGQVLGVGGPRGSFIIPMNFDGYLLVGDDTAMPAIARRLRELPAGAPTVVLVEVEGEDDRVHFESAAEVTLLWSYRSESGKDLEQALENLTLPPGDVHAWVACESGVAKAARAHLVGERNLNPKWVKAAGYWRQGTAATHDTHND